MKKLILVSLLLIACSGVMAQTGPEVTSWVINTTGATGYDGIPSNVQLVQYSKDSVYVSATCIPGYDIGPWNTDPNIPSNQNFVFCIPRHPQQNTGTPIATPLGHTGIWSNGVSIFSASDAMTYDNDGVWHRNAYYFEGVSFDSCLGHPQQTGEYHHHVNPKCLYNDLDSTHHSPIIGYAFDGFPIYGAYAYANTNGTGKITRMRSSYQYRNITVRDTLPNGTAASAIGPPVSSSYPIGDFLEDYQYIAGSGDLDQFNGRYCITPDYPSGTYAYFVTIDSNRNPIYPYTIGLSYYGIPYSGDMGPTSGHLTVSDSVTTYTPATTGIASINQSPDFRIFPNPAAGYIYVFVNPTSYNNFTLSVTDISGKEVIRKNNVHPTITEPVNMSALPSGTYFIKIFNGTVVSGVKKFILENN